MEGDPKYSHSQPTVLCAPFSRLQILPILTPSMSSEPVLASSSWAIFRFKALESVEQGGWTYWFQYSHCHSQRERWRGLRHMGVNCVAKDIPPILIHRRPEAICIGRLWNVSKPPSCAWEYPGGSSPVGALIDILCVADSSFLPPASQKD